jgi:Holliday junction resolvasome RuvABC endonuclease subunit
MSALKYVVGADPSTTRFGIACGGERDPRPRSFVWSLPGADDLNFDRTLSIAFGSAYELLIATKATDVFIEAPIIVSDRSAHTMVALMQLTGAVRTAAARAGVRVHMVASSTVRKHFLGNGRPDDPKRAVKERCRLLGYEVADDNAADACAVWNYGISKVCPKWSPNGTLLFGGARA